jgi:hypothetical protein
VSIIPGRSRCHESYIVERLRALRHLAHLIVCVGILWTWRALVTVHGSIIYSTIHRGCHLGAIESMGHGAIDGAVVHWATHSAVSLAVHLAVHGIVTHRSIHVLIQGSSESAIVCTSYGQLRTYSGGFVLFTHAIDVRPEALAEPAYLSKNLFTAHHFFFAVACGGDVSELIDESASGIDKLGELRRCPVWYEGLVKSSDMGFSGRSRKGVIERGSVLPGGSVAL